MSELPASLPEAERLVPADAPEAAGAVPLRLVPAEALEAALGALSPAQRAWVEGRGFKGKLGSIVEVPGEGGALAAVLFGWGDAGARARGRFHLGKAAESLGAGTYALDPALADLGDEGAEEAALGWLLSRLRYRRFKAGALAEARLAAPAGVDAARVHRIADAVALARALVETPAADLGPAEIEAAARTLAAEHGAAVDVVAGDALAEGWPMIHAVGKAAEPARGPRRIRLSWGPEGAPRVTLVGKGVAFDTGGLGLKPSGSMALMKKDMGGAAQALGLARLVMASGLKVRLTVLIPAVENAVSGGAFRPGDVLRSRKGLTVEVNHTDAEGRLVLADCLAEADEAGADLMFCFATLTGAARVALGPELPALFTDDEALAAALAEAARRVRDPLWRLPLWPGYEELIEPRIADLDNAPTGGMAGAITAALFLKRFVARTEAFAHMDLYAWTPKAKPGRPAGGEAQGLRAAFEVIAARAGA